MSHCPIAIVLFVLALHVSFESKAQITTSMCEAPLSRSAFDTSDFQQSQQIMYRQKQDVCNREFTSKGEAVSAAERAGASVGYGAYSVSANDAKATSSSSYSIKDSQFCQASAQEFAFATNSVARTQIASHAVNAWLQCVRASLSGSKLYIDYEQAVGAKGIKGIIRRYLPQGFAAGIGKVEGISVIPPTAKVDWRIDVAPVKINTKIVPIQLTKNDTAISCTKSPTDTVQISVITDQGAIDFITAKSKKLLESSSIEDRNKAIDSLVIRVKSLESRVASLQSELGGLASSATQTRADLESARKSGDDTLTARANNLEARINVVATKIFMRPGNNGTASCNSHCKNSPEFPNAVCVGATRGGVEGWKMTCASGGPEETAGSEISCYCLKQ